MLKNLVFDPQSIFSMTTVSVSLTLAIGILWCSIVSNCQACSDGPHSSCNVQMSCT